MERHKSISKALDSDTNRSMTHVRATSLRDGIVVDINDPIKVKCNNFAALFLLTMNVGRARDARLHTAVSSGDEYSIISVQR